MPKVVVHREDGGFIEISDLTFEQVRELAGLNGHRLAVPRKRTTDSGLVAVAGNNDVHGFLSALPERGHEFLSALRDHPDGIDAHALAPLLKLNDPRQIGGFTGGGLAKLAKKYKINMRDIYKSQVTFPAGKRTRMFYPGKLIKKGAI